MTLLQQILHKIEADAAAASERAMAQGGAIAEAEVLRDLLRANGCPEAEASFDAKTGEISFSLFDDSARVRQAIEDAGLEIESEFWTEHAPRVRQLRIKSLLCAIWITNDRPALAMAA